MGAQKAGTTSLHAYLCQHPQVLGARGKEVHFFDFNFARGLNWYRRQCPSRLRAAWQRIKARRPVLIGESTPYYLFHPYACDRIAEALPGVRIIILLRDPAARAYSHYRHNVRAGWESLSFDEALAQESQRMARAEAKLAQDEQAISHEHAAYSYQARGRYLDQLLRFERAFGKANVKVLSSESLFRAPTETYGEVLDFLGLEPFAPPAVSRGAAFNQGEKVPQSGATLARLRHEFAAGNEALFRHLGRRFDWAEPSSI